MKRRGNTADNISEVILVDHGWSLTKTGTDVYVTGVKEITSSLL